MGKGKIQKASSLGLDLVHSKSYVCRTHDMLVSTLSKHKSRLENNPSKVNQIYAINGINFQQLMTNPQ